MIIENPNRIFDNDSAFDEIIIEDFAANEMQDLIEMENISPYDFMKDDNNNNI